MLTYLFIIGLTSFLPWFRRQLCENEWRYSHTVSDKNNCQSVSKWWLSFLLCIVNAGKYKVEIFDRQQNRYIPSVSGLGMHVDVRDPEDKTVLSRVSINVHFCCYWY